MPTLSNQGRHLSNLVHYICLPVSGTLLPVHPVSHTLPLISFATLTLFN